MLEVAATAASTLRQRAQTSLPSQWVRVLQPLSKAQFYLKPTMVTSEYFQRIQKLGLQRYVVLLTQLTNRLPPTNILQVQGALSLKFYEAAMKSQACRQCSICYLLLMLLSNSLDWIILFVVNSFTFYYNEDRSQGATIRIKSELEQHPGWGDAEAQIQGFTYISR